MHVRWDAGVAVTRHSQLVFFAEFLAATGVFEVTRAIGNEGILLELDVRNQLYLLRLRHTANVQKDWQGFM